MTRTEIKAELRRSACKDVRPWCGLGDDAFDATISMMSSEEIELVGTPRSDIAVFFLLVAEAL